MRNILIYIWIVLITILSIPLLLIAKVTKGDFVAFHYIKFFAKSTNFIAGVKLKVENLEYFEQDETFLLVSNHEGSFDLFGIFAITGVPMGYVAKKEFSKVPIIRSWMRQFDTVFLDRSNPRQAIKDMNQGATNLKNKRNMGIMPEGTRSIEDQEFKPGSLKMAQKAKVKIIPLTIRNTASILENRTSNKKQTILFHFHKPITYEEYKDVELVDLAKNLQDKIHGVKL